MATKREQRIRLRCRGSAVKFDATIIESTPDGKRIRVAFDGPLTDRELFAFGNEAMLSDMKDREGKPTSDVKMAAESLYWEVL